MINLKEMQVTTIQFFDYSNADNCTDYSANIILDEKLVIQLSGNENEAHKASIPSATECYYNNAELQDWACENLDNVEAFLEAEGIENNYHYLLENCDIQL